MANSELALTLQRACVNGYVAGLIEDGLVVKTVHAVLEGEIVLDLIGISTLASIFQRG